MTNLEELDINVRHLTSFPDELVRLRKLKVLLVNGSERSKGESNFDMSVVWQLHGLTSLEHHPLPARLTSCGILQALRADQPPP